MTPTPRKKAAPSATLKIVPVTPSRWRDFERLFGEKGACAGCWCTYWLQTSAEFERNKGAGNRRKMKRIIEAGGRAPGVLAYEGREPIGWCAIAPRKVYSRLARSRVLAPVDDAPVWSISCFFVARPYRSQGVSVRLVEGAVEYAAKKGAKIVEGYPHIPSSDRMPDAFAWCGLVGTFKRAGFKEACRRSDSRAIMRRTIR